MLLQEFDQPPFAEPVGAELAANVAEHQFGGTAVGGDDARDVVVGHVARFISHGRKVQALVEDFPRLAGAASRHRSANVALVGNAAAKAEQRAIDEHGRNDGDVGRVRAAAVIGVIDQKGVAFRDGVAKCFEHRAAAGRKCSDMQRQHDMLGDDIAVAVHQGAGGILGFADDRRETGAEQRILHFLDDAAQTGLDDFEVDSIDGSAWGHAASSVMTMFFHSSTRALWPGHTTVVQSNWSRIAGPGSASPTSRRSRW